MPRVSVWLVRASLLHLLSGAILGASYLAWRAAGWLPYAATHRPVHVEQMLVGWLVQLVIGVAWWILPRPEAGVSRRAAALIWLVFVLLNTGVLLVALAATVMPDVLLPGGRVAETAAVALFAALAWNRQRSYRATARRVLV